jgi:hypothetical protein
MSQTPPTSPPSPAQGQIVPASQASRQLGDLPSDELNHLAENFGLDPTDFKTKQHLVVALHDRRQLIASMDRDAMLDVVRWGRRPIPINAGKEQIAIEISRIHVMRFDGLSGRGLSVLAMMRGIKVEGTDTPDRILRKLRKQEGFFKRLNRKRRAWIGGMISSMLGEPEPSTEYQFLPAQPGANAPVTSARSTVKDEIEEAGVIGGLTSRLKKSADSYLNQKLDEIEARIDRKLDEIDRRLAEWRDKEIANRVRIMKITLWVSVIVALISLIYSYVQVYITPSKASRPPTTIQSTR